mmetsp:Transcript_39454/g.29142  ORF Transcript_39454/g.29142 Transcript_39454/m.29142 type:complete len:99 (-) Transcript_39454:3-299(-)
MNQLGNLNLAHFIDLNRGEQPFNLPYTQQVKRCEETERRILNLINECKGYRVQVKKPVSISSFLEALQCIKQQKNKAASLLFEEIETDIKEKERFVMN